jgi:hypothetical protein
MGEHENEFEFVVKVRSKEWLVGTEKGEALWKALVPASSAVCRDAGVKLVSVGCRALEPFG